MQRLAWIAALVVCLGASTQVAAQGITDTTSMVNAARHAVVGHVIKVESGFGTNAYGDQLIYSRVSVAAEEVLRGQAPASFDVVVEGGTVGDVTLEVSDVATLHAGDRAVFLLTNSSGGATIPFDRGRGILPLDQTDHVKGEGLSLAQIRRLCAAQGR